MHLIVRNVTQCESGFVADLQWQHEAGAIFESRWFAPGEVEQTIRNACPAETYEFEPDAIEVSAAAFSQLPVLFEEPKQSWWKRLLSWLWGKA